MKSPPLMTGNSLARQPFYAIICAPHSSPRPFRSSCSAADALMNVPFLQESN